MQALHKQLRFELEAFEVKENSIETVFIGGGTPSTVSPQLFRAIFELFTPYLTQDAEITSEANPNSASREWMQGMKELGVNRLSFGVQSFNAEKLKMLNRAHTPQMAHKSITHASEIGFKNISLDLIYATLGDTKELLKFDLKEAEGTAFEKKPQMAKEQLEVTEWIFDAIKKHGFSQYEISNFGTYRSKHNLGYWQYKDYIGAGAGAVGKRKLQRFYPNPDIEAYIKDPLSIKIEELSDEDARLEKIFLGFRSCVGVDLKILSDAQKLQASILVKEKKLNKKGDILYNPDYLLADELALFLSS